jgi:hypothetical protein
MQRTARQHAVWGKEGVARKPCNRSGSKWTLSRTASSSGGISGIYRREVGTVSCLQMLRYMVVDLGMTRSLRKYLHICNY